MKKIVLLTFLICFGVNAQMKIEKLKLEMVAKTLHNKKSIVIKSNVYYRVTGGLACHKHALIPAIIGQEKDVPFAPPTLPS